MQNQQIWLKTYIKFNIFIQIAKMKVKDRLIEQINEMENVELMNSISSMLSNINEKGVFELDSQQLDELNKRSQKISNGDFKTHLEVSKKYNK